VKKSVIAILAVAIIGALGIYAKGHDSSTNSLLPASSTSTNASGTSVTNSAASTQSTTYKDGTYTGNSEDTPYGIVQIAAVVSGGKITSVNFLQMPSDLGHSQEVTSFSEPLLKQTTIQKQSAHIDFVSGATTTSEAYQQSLQSALNQAV
jgi:uncharacterized protein with FMN-binding domain